MQLVDANVLLHAVNERAHEHVAAREWLQTALGGGEPVALAWIVTLAFGGLSVMMWAVFLRTVLGLHSTWFVNSATHMWGSRRFLTTDTSTNSFWVAMLTFGEGWHNNHHKYPGAARQGFFWWEIDITYYGLLLLARLRIIRDLRPVPSRLLGCT